jgi:SPP1 gp7 family putative phage head morphogenesis protein
LTISGFDPVPESNADILRIAFRLPYEKAIAYLEQKGYKFSWHWQETLADAHEKAFVVAKVARMDILVAIKEMVTRAQKDGISLYKFQRSLEPYLKLTGWWGRTWARNDKGELLDADGKPFPLDADGAPIIPEDMTPPLLGSPARLETIYQTNLQTAFAAGEYAGLMSAVKLRPYWQYISVRDGRTTQLCTSLHGSVFAASDAFWSYFYPPNHWRCRGSVRSLSMSEIKEKNLSVSKSKGKIGQEEVLISTRTGETGTASTYTGTDPDGKKHVYRNDPAFNYNPGRETFKPDLEKYPPELQKAYKKEKQK